MEEEQIRYLTRLESGGMLGITIIGVRVFPLPPVIMVLWRM